MLLPTKVCQTVNSGEDRTVSCQPDRDQGLSNLAQLESIKVHSQLVRYQHRFTTCDGQSWLLCRTTAHFLPTGTCSGNRGRAIDNGPAPSSIANWYWSSSYRSVALEITELYSSFSQPLDIFNKFCRPGMAFLFGGMEGYEFYKF